VRDGGPALLESPEDGMVLWPKMGCWQVPGWDARGLTVGIPSSFSARSSGGPGRSPHFIN
jgi:hypothetical protein